MADPYEQQMRLMHETILFLLWDKPHDAVSAERIPPPDILRRYGTTWRGSYADIRRRSGARPGRRGRFGERLITCRIRIYPGREHNFLRRCAKYANAILPAGEAPSYRAIRIAISPL